jgi:hypothetical protein
MKPRAVWWSFTRPKRRFNPYLSGPNYPGKKRDFFGDFAFADLVTGKYSVKIDAAGYTSQTKDFELTEDTLYLGAIKL